jgi:outer membrane protein assembly factor BamB
MHRLRVALLASLLAADVAAAARCLDGPSRLADQRDLAALRTAIDATCRCNGPRRAYRRCAQGVRDAAIVTGALRRACRATATRAYRDTTCGRPGHVACGRVTARATGCRIEPAGRCTTRPRVTKTACTAETHCTDVVDFTGGTCAYSRETSVYGPGWSTIHADAANTDYSPVPGVSRLRLAWERSFGELINVGTTSSPDGVTYVTTSAGPCHLHALDAATGATRWCSEEVGRFAVVSSALVDRDGRLFVADHEAMHAFDRDGTLLWETPIVGVPLSAQFTRKGRLLFITHIGRIYLLQRETGAALLPPIELIPGATFDPAQGLLACARGLEACPAANTLAIDHRTGRFFFTFWAPGTPQAGLRAMLLDESTPVPTITHLWTNDTLPGGSGSSPTLPADASRVYVNDNVDALHAIDAATGAPIWSFAIGWAPGGSPSLSPEGVIMPAGGDASPLLALVDRGPVAELLWRRDDLLNRGIPTQAAGGRSYATVNVAGFVNDLVVVDTATGAVLDRDPLPGTTIFTVGTTVGPDGTVYVPTFNGHLFAFRPE